MSVNWYSKKVVALGEGLELSEGLEVVYTPAKWELLKKIRLRASKIMASLASRMVTPYIYGSVARGDVNSGSDIDVITLAKVSSHSVELALTFGGFKIHSRKIAQATPGHTIKAHVYLDAYEKECVTFPLTTFRGLELDFYNFAGFLDLPSLNADRRVAGCDKRLMLIQPTKRGHVESPVEGREVEVTKVVGASLEIVNERIRVLKRRRSVGRTGIVLSKSLEEGEVFEDVLRRLAASNPIVRRSLRERG